MLVRARNKTILTPEEIISVFGCDYFLDEENACEIYTFEDKFKNQLVFTIDSIDEFSARLVISGEEIVAFEGCTLTSIYLHSKTNFLIIGSERHSVEFKVWPKFSVAVRE